jgi:hypothetical protein
MSSEYYLTWGIRSGKQRPLYHLQARILACKVVIIGTVAESQTPERMNLHEDKMQQSPALVLEPNSGP